MRRVLCVWLPGWPIQRLRAVRPELEGQPVILFGESPRGGLQVVQASCREASPGMPLAEARALCPKARFERHDPSADAEFLQILATECERFSPLVGFGEEASLLMDVTGCDHLFGGEQSLVNQVIQFITRRNLISRVSLADTIGAAWAVCRYARGGVIDATDRALPPLPAAALRLSASIIETLNELGIRTIGQLAALPRGSLASRFGPEVAKRLDQTFGRLPELIVPIRPSEPVRAECTFDEPITDRRSLELALHQLIEQIAEALQQRQQGAQRLECRVGGISFVLGTTSPTATASHLWELVRLHLERLALPGEVTRIEIQAVMTARRIEEQQQIIPDDRVDRRELRRLLDRLGSRLGEEALLQPTLVPDPLPEHACQFVPVLEGEAATAGSNSTGLFRPLRMLPQPIPVEVVSVVPDGPPIQFRWKQEHHVITGSWGPERITSGWWRDQQVRRDYYRVETSTGQRFWLFRNEGAWFLHGAFE